MRPYSVEIFDRGLNFLYTTLLDADEFVYRFDLMDPVKNTIMVPKDFKPAALRPNEPTAPYGWYIRIFRPGEEYQGYISGFEAGEVQNKITFSQMITLFDISCYVDVAEELAATIENYIKTLIIAEFVNNSDSLHITGLTAARISTTTSTTGSFEYQDTDDEYTVIDLLDDLIYPAFTTYSIVTDVTFDPQTKAINVTIGRNTSAAVTIEADLPNVIDAEYTIRKSSKEVNRLDIYDSDTEPPTIYSYYLHPGGSWNTTDNNRIYPVVNNITVIKGRTLARKVVDKRYNLLLRKISAYADYDGTLSASQITELNTAISTFLPKYLEYFGYPANGAEAVNGRFVNYDQTDTTETNAPIPDEAENVKVASYTYDIVAAKKSKVALKAQLHFTPYSSWNQFWIETDTPYITMDYGSDDAGDDGTTNHVRVTATIRMINYEYYNLIRDQAGDWVIGYKYPAANATMSVHFTHAMAKKAFEEYKKTDEYAAEVEAVYGQTADEVMQEKAAEIFGRNRYSNLIELQTISNDSMVKPLELTLGRTANVIHDGVQYSTILSGREVDRGKTLLRFGTIRLELTSYLKGRY